MQQFNARVRSLGLDPSGRRLAHISLPGAGSPAAGQPFLARATHEPTQPLRFTLFPSELTEAGFRAPLPEGAHWQPGDTLDLVGPIGKGFSPPNRAARWLLVPLTGQLAPLLPLIEIGLKAGKSLALLGRVGSNSLPPEVEILPDAEEGLAWAEILAVSALPGSVGDVRAELRLGASLQPGCPAQVLIAADLPCGIGACRTCPVKTSGGWRWACLHGPVFEFDDLDL